jgi:threonine dehydrogenase-like Zn-dependent dehydrogenase
MGIVGADGAFAERMAVPLATLHRVPDAVEDAVAVFTEPVAAAFEILEQLGDVGGRRAVVLGDGKLGLLVAQVLRQAGAPRGTVVLKTTVAVEHHLDLAPAVVNEVTVLGSRCGPFAPALAALAAGRVAVAPLIDAVYPLEDGVAALARAATAGVFKILLAPGS